ncbi:hypothetical protein POTOM_005068 [Populus tomentosa]|uniref:Uncharacterized protein n=1 Tax=Populus tomentosa TaxID=118781 RepID=A0A8X8ARJ3_POPTO|nr:hypothetical protein POTOM_005068 [Populus tomentosa]
MDGSDNKSVSSTPNKRLSFSKLSRKEFKCVKPKETTNNNSNEAFHVPTISAASKANPPRRKILAESNGSLDTHLQKNPTLGSKTISSIEFAEYGENVLLDHLSSRPYDPLTSYISPRPFLRYKPNRHRDIFLRRENVAREETRRENEEEFEEVEEERCQSLKRVLKILLLLVVLVLSTSYIPSMKSPTPSLVMQAFGNPNNGFHMVQDHITEATTMSGSPFINDGDDSLAMPSSIPENFEKENEVANEPVTKKVVDGGIVIACLTLGFHFKRKRNAQKDSSPVVQPSFEPVVVEKCLPMFASEADKNVENIVPFTNSANSMEEKCKVGEISSLSSCGMESRMIESEVISIRSVSMEKGDSLSSCSCAASFLRDLHHGSPSPSYGRFIIEKKIVKKQEGADGENKKDVVTTPVMRSSRIRNRSIVSP